MFNLKIWRGANFSLEGIWWENEPTFTASHCLSIYGAIDMNVNFLCMIVHHIQGVL